MHARLVAIFVGWGLVATLGCTRVADGVGFDDGGSDGTDADEVTGGSPGSEATTNDDESSTGNEGGPKLDVASPETSSGDDPPPLVPTCDTIDEFPATSLGCVFWSADIPPDHSTNGYAYPYGVAIGNPSATDIASITIEDRRGAAEALREVTSFTLMPGESRMTAINGTGGALDGQSHSLALGTNLLAAFRVVSDVPVTATQFNLVGGAPTEMPEASTLLPEHVLGGSYLSIGGPENARVAVVAIEDDTTVTTPTGDVVLDAFDAWYGALEGATATGSWFSADKPVAAFSGSYVTFVPAGICCADSLEEQLVPLAAWGTRYVAARHPHRLPDANPDPEAVYWKLIAAEADTTITLTPAVEGVWDEVHLAAFGEVFELSSTASFVAESDKRFMLVQFMASAGTITLPDPYTSFGGDPFMVQMPPIEQWLAELPFLTDTSYAYDFVTIARESGTSVEIECLGEVPDDRFVPIDGTDYEVAQVFLDAPDVGGGEGDCVDGQQFLRADAPVGIVVGGYDSWASYGYPGGLGISTLWQPPIDPAG
jgi:hypothetical protein